MPVQQKSVVVTANYVGIKRRIGAFVYDSFLLLATLIFATAIIMPFTQKAIHSGSVIFQIYIFLIIFVFYGWFWTHGGQTLGMRAWKIRVELENGQNLNWTQAGLRFVLAILTFGVGLLWCLWDEKHRAFHDRLARTQVVLVEEKYVPPV